jgi:AAA15 family ATPase/GTPase
MHIVNHPDVGVRTTVETIEKNYLCAMSEEKKDWKINELSIQNFKSIKDLKIKPNRVNIFIGKPNAGKSNLLEALTFLGMKIRKDTSIPHEQIRYIDVPSLFYDQDYNNSIRLYTDGDTWFNLFKEREQFIYTNSADSDFKDVTIDWAGNFINSSNQSVKNIRKYQFNGIPTEQFDRPTAYLIQNGNNLWNIVRHNSKLKEFAIDFFKDYSLELLFDLKNKKIDLMRKTGDAYYLIDFSMTPDTFQRMLYYLAAIESNKNTVILFEEPEAQSYPPYIQMLAERIVDDLDNQYFISTHSPFIVEKMLEHAGTSDDVKIFVTYFEDYQTKVHELTREEIDQILDYNVDLFFNMEAYQK